MPLEPRPVPAVPDSHLRELKDIVRALLKLDDDTAVVIRQLSWTAPGHRRVETSISARRMDGRVRHWTLDGPTDQITENALRAALIPHPTNCRGCPPPGVAASAATLFQMLVLSVVVTPR
ncbi:MULTISPECIES: hypothetical protein [unclassified Streptomyces]|uniref:hypothetical protein n=1 Tax=unclassified Streptomyces TaxID=2593676 RepID=UPI0033A826FA